MSVVMSDSRAAPGSTVLYTRYGNTAGSSVRIRATVM